MGRNNIHIHLVFFHLCSNLLLALNETVVKFYIEFESNVRDNIINLQSLTGSTLCKRYQEMWKMGWFTAGYIPTYPPQLFPTPLQFALETS